MNLMCNLNPLSVRPGNGLLTVAALALSLSLACSGGGGGGGTPAPPAAPTVPVITAPDNVTENQAGYAATTPAQAAGTTFAWTITSGGVIQGVATGTSITFTPDAFPGTVALSCVATKQHRVLRPRHEGLHHRGGSRHAHHHHSGQCHREFDRQPRLDRPPGRMHLCLDRRRWHHHGR